MPTACPTRSACFSARKAARRDHGSGAEAGARAVARRARLVRAVATSECAGERAPPRSPGDRPWDGRQSQTRDGRCGRRAAGGDRVARALLGAEAAASADERAAAVAARLDARDVRGWVESAAGGGASSPITTRATPCRPERITSEPGGRGSSGWRSTSTGASSSMRRSACSRISSAPSARLRSGTCRLGIYPGPQTVSIGAQAMLSGGQATPDRVRDVMAKFVEPLSALGALPYRRAGCGKRSRDPACEPSRVRASPAAPRVNGVHPALAFCRRRCRRARAVGADTLRLEVDGERVDIFVAPEERWPRVLRGGWDHPRLPVPLGASGTRQGATARGAARAQSGPHRWSGRRPAYTASEGRRMDGPHRRE